MSIPTTLFPLLVGELAGRLAATFLFGDFGAVLRFCVLVFFLVLSRLSGEGDLNCFMSFNNVAKNVSLVLITNCKCYETTIVSKNNMLHNYICKLNKRNKYFNPSYYIKNLKILTS